MNKLTVGAYIKYYCSRCKLELGHTVLAMVGASPARVKCDTCKSERNYRQADRLSSVLDAPQASRRIAPVERPKYSNSDLYAQKMREAVMKDPKPFSMKQAFAANDVITHPSFGKGIVLKLIHPDRMEVLFQDQMRVLARMPSSNES